MLSQTSQCSFSISARSGCWGNSNAARQPQMSWSECKCCVLWPQADSSVHPERPVQVPQTGSWVQRFHSISTADRWAAGALRPQTPSASGREQRKHTICDYLNIIRANRGVVLSCQRIESKPSIDFGNSVGFDNLISWQPRKQCLKSLHP